MKKKYIQPSIKTKAFVTDDIILAGSTFDVPVKDEDFDPNTMTSLSGDNGNLWDDDYDDFDK